MDHGDYHWGLYRDYYRDPFPHSLLITREPREEVSETVSSFPTCSAKEDLIYDFLEALKG